MSKTEAENDNARPQKIKNEENYSFSALTKPKNDIRLFIRNGESIS
jgi:hypothetical protein